MLNKYLFIYLSVALAFLIPFPARLAYGLIVFIEMQLLMLAGTVGRELFFKFGMEEVQKPLISVLLIAVTLLYKFILTFLSPVMALTMGFSIFIPALCAFLLGTLFEKKSESLSVSIKKNMKLSVFVTSPFLIFFLLRDIIAYGSITLPSHNGILVLHIIPGGFKATTMIASIAGALFLIGLCVACMVLHNKHLEKVAKKQNSESDEKNNSDSASEPLPQEPLATEETLPENSESTSAENQIQNEFNAANVQDSSNPTSENDAQNSQSANTSTLTNIPTIDLSNMSDTSNAPYNSGRPEQTPGFNGENNSSSFVQEAGDAE